MPTDTARSNCLRYRAFNSLRLGENLNKEFGNSRFIRASLSMRIGIPDKGRSGGRIPPPTEQGSQDPGLANPASRAYALAKTIVHGLLVLMVWPVGVSVPVAWSTVNCTIVSVFFSSGGPKPSSAFAA
jgi:hypothetical protein